jgi:superfamily I DNA/RNA helicase
MTTLQRLDGSLTSDLKQTKEVMLDHLIPTDELLDDTDYHKRIRDQTKEPIYTADDRDYSPDEVKNAIEELNHKKNARGRLHHRRYISESLQTIPDIY